jgi:cardiolipin synthase A/B
MVTVCILLDWLGSRGMDVKLLEAARAAGCDLQLYRPPAWFHLGRLNNRTHRKVLIVDGVIGFTGGVGMCSECLARPRTKLTGVKATIR